MEHQHLSELLRDLVRTGMTENDWSQQELADQAGVSPKHISQLLNGKVAGSVDVWDRLLKAVSGRDQEEGISHGT